MTKNRPYTIIPYNSNWPILFSNESKIINDIIGNNILKTHHIGSTSVQGMSSKSTVDILFIVKDISTINDSILDMKKIGYTSFGSLNSKNSHLFEKIEDEQRTFIIHFYPKGHPEIKQILAIRDYLRSHKDAVGKYSTLKLSLFHKFPNDYTQYRLLKNEYMNDLKNRAVSWAIDNTNN